MRRYAAAVPLLCLLAASAAAQGSGDYTIRMDGSARSKVVDTPEKKGRFVTVQFKIFRDDAKDPIVDVPDSDKFVVYEDDRLRKELEIDRPRSGPLTTVLAMDISGSMDKSDKMTQARRAGNIFLDRLHSRADVGLILFDHLVRLPVPPIRDSQQFLTHRNRIRGHINEAKPMGGTAYLDAAAHAVEMLQTVPGRRAIVVMTDGVDLNSKKTLDEVVEQARSAEIPVYTLGVGEPGKNDPVTTVLVLDHSGSMLAKARREDKQNKFGALKEAANRFVNSIRPGARTTLLPFSDRPGKPGAFTDDKDRLRNSVHELQAKGETALFDAVYDGLTTLQIDTQQAEESGKPLGRRAIVAMTDGVDNMSRRRVDQVIKLARETKAPLYMLGLGAPNQIDEKVMRRMAEETGGKYYHAANADQLIEIFENLSIQLHDDGIDEQSLKRLAEATGGKYYQARNVEELGLMYERVAEELQTTYRITFPSWRPQSDGTVSKIKITVQRDGKLVSNVASDTIVRHGVVAAQMHPVVYLSLLLVLGGLLALPIGVRRLYRTVGE